MVEIGKGEKLREKGGYSNMLEINFPLPSLVCVSTFFSPLQLK